MNNIFLTAAVAFLYMPVLARLTLFFFPPTSIKFFAFISSLTGRVEWALRPWRNWLAFLCFFEAACYLAYEKFYLEAASFLVFIFLSIFSELRFRFHLKRMAEFARKDPFIRPELFFNCYYAGFGILPIKHPQTHCHARESAVPAASYWRGNPVNSRDPHFRGDDKTQHALSKRLLPVIFGLFNTLSLSRMIVAAYKWKGPKYSREVSDAICPIWCSRVAQLGRIALKVAGLEALNSLSGKFIFAFAHKSYLDFAVGPLAIACARPRDRSQFRLRFLAAKDHFLDNKFLYLLMGRALRVMGTIFVERRKGSPDARNASVTAAEKLASLDIDIVIFPQGTRAYANITPDGKRLDSGYYTSGSKERLLKTGGHLKKGTAHIAVDTAISMKMIEQSVVHIIPIGLVNTGLAAPKKSILVQTGADITVKVGPPITITGKDVASIEVGSEAYLSLVENIHERLDLSLKAELDTHAMLEQRFFKDIRSLVTPSDYEHASVAMKAWRGKDYLIYTLLDCIYATKPANWPALVRELCYLLISDAPQASFAHFKGRIVELMIEG